jgi:phosphoribosyl-dephospho-CoA transferase
MTIYIYTADGIKPRHQATIRTFSVSYLIEKTLDVFTSSGHNWSRVMYSSSARQNCCLCTVVQQDKDSRRL